MSLFFLDSQKKERNDFFNAIMESVEDTMHIHFNETTGYSTGVLDVEEIEQILKNHLLNS